MAKRNTIDMKLPAADDLFTTQAERDVRESVKNISISEISDFPDHPFKVVVDESMEEMAQSVKEYGVLVPALVRPKPDGGGYEMVAGHRRKMASELAEKKEMPCIVRDLTDDEAILIMVDSNLQREKILPSEKAFAYKMKLEAMKRQAGRPSKENSAPLGQNFGRTSREVLAEKSPDSNSQIQRYIRLTELIPPILNMVDENKIAMRPAVELSYLPKVEQDVLFDTMQCEDCTPSHAQAIKMRKFSEQGKLTNEVILSIMQEEKGNQKEQFRMPRERISKYFSPGTSEKQMVDTIVKALEMYQKRQRAKWKEPERRQRLTDYYNKHFNAMRPREYDGSHLHFYGMNPEIKLRQHQKNGAARIIYGGNALLAYVVGAGKTYTMVAAAMESKRLGLCSKSMVVVPNHIIEQFAAEWLQLYPAANILVATKKDFETKNRRKFCARIATGDWDAVIIGHSQFEKIPVSVERQRRLLMGQIEEIMEGIKEAKRQRGSRFSVKQLEKAKKSLMERMKRLNDQSRKDSVVTFEELGIDRLFVDEADNYKNLYLYTKMRNVGGIAQTEALKSSDMFMKCQYLDELTGGKGVVFSTGTPVSNSMVELYTMQRYLQYGTLVQKGLQHFDAWASTFGETVAAIELAPEGSGYRMKTRFAKFYNLPELMMMFKEVADIQTADMLNLPVPEAEYRVVSVKPSAMQKSMVAELGERAERVRDGRINPSVDNMLKITNDGRKLALDQRLINALLPDDEGSKINACVDEVYRFWLEGKDKKLTQLLFCDLSTPKNDGTFSVYNDVREKLIAKGIPPEEIAFIHDANTDVRKKELFSKVRRGAVRVLMGSTFKMGAGTNVQDRIIASHDLDCPWRPRDLEQRAGRTVRQGNTNPKVDVIRYVTEGTFDAYLYQIIENKQKFISQIMTSKSPARTVEDIDEVALSYAEIKALASGNPRIKEKMDLDVQVSKLQLLKQSFLSQKYEMEDKVVKHFPREIKEQEERIAAYEADIAQVKAHTTPERDTFPAMQVQGVAYTEKKAAGQAIIAACKKMYFPNEVPIGEYRGLSMSLSYNTFAGQYIITLQGKLSHHVTLGEDIFGNVTRLDNEIEKFPDNLERCRERLENTKAQLENAKEEAKKEFPKEQELREKSARLAELNAMLDMDKVDKVILDEGDAPEPEKKREDKER